MLDPRAIAVGGAGYGALLLSTLGMWPVDEPVEPPIEPPHQVAQVRPVGGGHYDTGNGYVRRDHSWIKVTKVAKYGASNHWSGEAGGTVVAQGRVSRFGVHAIGAEVLAGTLSEVTTSRSQATYGVSTPVTGGEALGMASRFAVQSNTGKVDTLGMDEILAIFELMDSTA